jgi:hypothetical protein
MGMVKMGWVERIGDRLVQINTFTRNGKKVMLIYGIGSPIRKGSIEEREAYSLGFSYIDIDEVEVLTADP